MVDPRRPLLLSRSSGRRSPWPLLAAAVLFGGCAVGPNYHRPVVVTPPAFREAPGWKAATPADATLRGAWWEVFQDPDLSRLEAQVAPGNFSLAQAEAEYEEERQLARADEGTLFPTVSIDGSATRQQETSHGGVSSVGSGGGPVVVSTSTAPVNFYSASGSATWALDLWGRVRRQLESDVATAQSDAALLASTRLSLQSTLAQDYIQLRSLDEQRRLLENAVADYRKTLQISQNKYQAGVAARSDVISAQAQVDATRAQEVNLGVQRANLEHAIAVLVGKAPSELALPVMPTMGLTQPDVPGILPSELLERRPDIAQAERETAAANARIGVEMAAYFPTLDLTATGGFQGSSLSHLFELPNRVWSLGASGSDLLFNMGSNIDDVREARAGFDAAVANYREVVLGAFQQVEDELSALRILGDEAVIEKQAVEEAAQASQIALNEYRAGTVDYTTVVTAQVTELTDRESALSIEQQRLTAAVVLIQALGGGWNQGDLPAWGKVLAHRSQAPTAVSAPQ